MDGHAEIELKFAVPEAAMPELAAAVMRAGGERDGSPRKLRSVYFDTQDRRLRRNGFVLRIRSSGEGNVQTVKSVGSDGSAIGRMEWEGPVQGDRPVLAAMPDALFAKALRRKDFDALRPAFTVDVERETYVVARGGTVIEIALDRGAVRHGYEQRGFSEAEFELKRGTSEDLLGFAREIAASVPVILSLTTKADRGYRLGAGASGQPLMRVDYGLRRDMDAAEIARSLAHACLAALLDNLAMLAAGANGEALHQSRVCVRRLRALLSLLSAAFDWEDERSVRTELKWLSDGLGKAREFDVFVKAGLAPVEVACPDAPGFASLRNVFETRRNEAYAATLEALRSPRLLGMSLDLLTCFDEGSAALWSDQMKRAGGEAAWRGLEKELRRRLKSLLKDSRAIAELPPAKQHEIRIRAKKLRYMLEPFAGFLPPKGFRAITSALQAIQDELGDVNDDGVNHALALAYAHEPPADRDAADASLFAAGMVAATCQRSCAEKVGKAARARERLARAPALEFV